MGEGLLLWEELFVEEGEEVVDHVHLLHDITHEQVD